MKNSFFQFKQFVIHQDRTAMKVTTDSCLFGAWVAEKVKSQNSKVKSQKSKVKTVLDVGTGTGLLSLMFVQKNPDAKIDAIEIDKDAFQQAEENIAASPFAKKIHLIHADARKFSFEKKYDLIISNPPFYESELKAVSKKQNIAHHSEEFSLSDLFNLIKSNLSDDGEFFLMLPYKRQIEVRKLTGDHRFNLLDLVLIRQSFNHYYFRIIMHGNLRYKKNSEPTVNEISIWNDKQEYTKEFMELLKDYYL
jgi:tRNA1Val (adenine37-N6)-methyltransferase